MIWKRLIIYLGLLSLGWIVANMLLRSYCQKMEGTEFDLDLPEKFARLQPMFTKPGPPQPGEWLTRYSERGQTYQEYLRSSINKAVSPQNVIYVQPLGNFSDAQKEILDQTTDFIQDYFSLPVQLLSTLPLESIPDYARRQGDSEKEEQLQTFYLINEVLKPRRREDAYILIGFIAKDIWPGGEWNFVYGQAYPPERIAICSLARICSDKRISENRPLCLRRILKISTHEIGHLFSLLHCTLYICNEAGSNNLAEMDRHPLELCPQCLAKICYATGFNLTKRFEKLRDFYRHNGLVEDEILCNKLLSETQRE
jgi:archaemetzincin